MSLYKGSAAAIAAVILASVMAAQSAHAQIDIHLQAEKAGAGRIPVALRDFTSDTEALRSKAAFMAKVLRQDLEFSDIFEPLSLETGADTLTGGRTAAAIIEGSLERQGDLFVLDTRLLDFTSREVIFSKRFSFPRAAERSVSHKLSDEILFFLAGETGIATTRLLFTRRDGDVKSLYMIDYDGYDERQLTRGELVVSPVWLDYQRFCFTSYRRDNPDCYLVDIAAGSRTNISHRKGINIAGGYFAERDEIPMTLSVKGNSEIYIVSSTGKLGRRLTRNRAIDCSPSWSPNGAELTFVSDRTGSPQIYIMDRYGGNTRRLTRRGSYNTSPAWSPKGDQIAYVSREGWRYALMLITPGADMLEEVGETTLSYEDPSWAPDGRHLAVTVKYGNVPWIVIIDTATGRRRTLVKGESPAWSTVSGG